MTEEKEVAREAAIREDAARVKPSAEPASAVEEPAVVNDAKTAEDIIAEQVEAAKAAGKEYQGRVDTVSKGPDALKARTTEK